MDGEQQTEKRAEVLAELRPILADLIGLDGDAATGIGLTARFIDDLGVDSLELVVLGQTLNDRFGDTVDFVAFLADRNPEEYARLTVGHLVDHIVGTTRSQS